MRELVQYMVEAMVDEPDAVSVTAIDQEGLTVYTVEVAQADLGKVIGRHGRTAEALRTLVSAAAQKQNQRATVDILS